MQARYCTQAFMEAISVWFDIQETEVEGANWNLCVLCHLGVECAVALEQALCTRDQAVLVM